MATQAAVSPRKIIVGHANTYHDPAIAVLAEGQIYAEAIERHTQCKRALEMSRLWYSGRALRAALENRGIAPVENADVVSVSTWDEKLLSERLEEAGLTREKLLDQPELSLEPAIMSCLLSLEQLYLNQLGWVLHGYPVDRSHLPDKSAYNLFRERGITTSMKSLPHHLAHAATAVYTSPFDECLVLIVDGFGEETATSVYYFADNVFDLVCKNDPQSSLGSVFTLVTRLCGFNPYEGEEWKVMGLAAYGKKREKIYRFFKELMVVRGMEIEFQYRENSLSVLEALVGGFRMHDDPDVLKAADLACNFQMVFEEVMVDLARAVYETGKSSNLSLAGGCALNSAANGKILKKSGFRRLHVPSAPADDGTCLGAALYEKYCVLREVRRPALHSPYLGSELDRKRLEHILGFGKLKYEHMDSEQSLCTRVANLLAEGRIIGWIQGRAEFGPRALGNRSILADPRPPDMKDQINKKVKFREWFRPIAPSILHEFGDEYFEDYQETPYMERTLRFRDGQKEKVPAVVHEDDTGRLQTVKEEWNPRFYRLLRAFYERTGVPILANTSFNVMGKPIVHSVEDAFAVFYTTGMDYLVIDKYVISY